MSLLTPEQIAAAQKTNFDILFGLTNKAVESFERLAQLNLQAMKSTLAESQQNTQKAFTVKDPQELLALQASLMQPAAEQGLSYCRHLYEIVSATQAEFAKVAQAQYEAHKRNVQGLVDTAANGAPAGSEAAVAAWQSAVAATNTLYETMQQAAKQAVDITESNFNLAAAAASNAAQQTTAQATRATKR